MNYGDDLRARISRLQQSIGTGAAVVNEHIQVQLYRDHANLSQLEQLDQHFKQQTPIPEHRADSYTAFILSKPQRVDGALQLHAMQCLDQTGVPNGELWVKLKSAKSLAAKGADVARLDCHALQQQLLDGQPIPSCEARPVMNGPQWLQTEIDVGEGMDAQIWHLPVLETPMDVPERFAGHLYLKLLTGDHPLWRG